MRVVTTRPALADLQQIQEYVEQFNPAAAERLALSLIAAAESLAKLPERGRPIGGGYRELVALTPYVIRYRVDGDTVVILRVRHGMQRPESV